MGELTYLSRARGAFIGLAVGDALGTAVEGRAPGTFDPVEDIVGGGPFDLKPGQWTDDTSMALCLAESLVESNGFDPADQMTRYLRWWREGYLSSTGECFAIGMTVRTALTRFERNGEPYAGPDDPRTAGNGSLMRLGPVPVYFASDPAAAIRYAALSSRTTHGAPQAVDACRYFAGLIVAALKGADREEFLARRYSPVLGRWSEAPLHPAVEAVANGSFRKKQPPAIRAGAYVVESLEAALWAFDSTSDFRSGALAAANLGDDSDTTAAIFGQLAGAYYGEESIPSEWIGKLYDRERIESLADALASGAQESSSRTAL